MQSIPKTDLHIHLGGSFPFSYLETVGEPQDVAALSSFLDQMERKDCTDYHICFQAFALVGKIMNSLTRIEEGTAALCREMAADGVHYVEMRTGLKSLEGACFEDYVKAFLRGAQTGSEGTSLQVKWLLSLKRNSSAELAQETLRIIKKYRSLGIIGIDISDDALLGDGDSILSIIEEVRALHIPVALHIGECREETEEQQMRELTLIQPSRIGHGVFLCEAAKQYIFERQLPVEMCLSSAVRAHMVEKAQQHPAVAMLKEGHPVIVCTDDPLIFRTTHTQESELARSVLGYSLEQMGELHERSLQYKF